MLFGRRCMYAFVLNGTLLSAGAWLCREPCFEVLLSRLSNAGTGEGLDS